MPSLLSLLLAVPLGIAAVLAAGASARRLAWLAAAAYGVGAASVRVALRLPLGAEADPLWVGALPITSLRIDAGLQLLGAVLALASAALCWTGDRSIRGHVAGLISLLVAAAITGTALPLLRLAGWLPTFGAAVALGASFGIVGWVAVTAVTRLTRSDGRAAGLDESHFPRSPGPLLATLLGAGAIAAIAAPHLHIVILGAIAAALSAHAIVRKSGRGRLPAFPAIATGALAFVAYYVDVIAGPSGVGLAALPDAPLSTAAQALLLPALALGAVGFFALWPVAALTPGAWLAPIGVALLVRVGAEGLPLGVEGWRTVAIPVGVIGAWAAAFRRRPLEFASAGAWMACFAAPGGAAAAWLLALVPVLGTHRDPVGSVPDRGLRSLLRSLVVAGVGTLGGTLALDALLRAEVVYAVLAAAAAAFSAVYISRART